MISTSFHHMDEWGGYDGWTDHDIFISASFIDPEITSISGRDRNDIKDYIAQLILADLATRVLWTAEGIERLPEVTP